MTHVICIKVANLRKDGYNNLKEWMKNPQNIYIGRRGIVFIDNERFPKQDSFWANPFKIDKDNTREEVLKKYKNYILEKLLNIPIKDSYNLVLELKDKTLGCWCKPEACHGDILLEIVKCLDLSYKKYNNVIEKIEFYDAKDKYGEFSNFYSKKEDKNFNLIIDGLTWPTTEHYYQAQKFLGSNFTNKSKKYADIIRNAKTPGISKILAGQKQSGGYKWRTDLNIIIDQYKDIKIRDDWEDIKENIMEKALLEKFKQNNRLYELLKNTHDSLLIEHTSRDKYWGDGGDGTGKNRLGYLLMKVRNNL